MDEERIRPGHWLWLLLCVSFSALTLMLVGRKDIWPMRRPPCTNSQSFHSRTGCGGGLYKEPSDSGSSGKPSAKQK